MEHKDAMAAHRRTIVGVMGSGSNPHPELARPIGRFVAELGCHLLTGGGGGVMAEVNRAFCEVESRAGRSIGILKGETTTTEGPGGTARSHLHDRANDWVEIPIHTHLPLSGSAGADIRSRNHINVLTSDILVALPGEEGTYSEVMLRIEYGKSVILCLGPQSIYGRKADHFLEMARYEGQVQVAACAEEVRDLLRETVGRRSDTASGTTSTW